MKRVTFSFFTAVVLFFTAVGFGFAPDSQDAGTDKNDEKAAKKEAAPVDPAKVREVYEQGRASYFGLDGQEVDRIKGFRYLKAAMNRGSVEAQGLVAWILYVYGEPYRKVDKKEGYRLADEIADKENPFALETQARGLFEGFAVKRDVDLSWTLRSKAARALDVASKNGDPLAMFLLAQYWIQGCFEKISPNSDSMISGVTYSSVEERRQALSYLERATQAGFPDAACALGYMLILEGGDENEKRAFELFQRAVERKDPDAYAFLGCCYNAGKGTAKDRLRALELFEEGDLRDSALAAEALASRYLANSEGVFARMRCFKWVSQDILFLRQKEKNGGDVSSTRSTATFLRELKETDVAKAYSLLLDKEAFKELAKSRIGGAFPPGVDEETLRAFYSLHLTPEFQVSSLKFHKNGVLTSPRLEKETDDDVFARRYVAFKLYEKAARKHSDSACFSLCRCYYQGLGVDRNIEKAVESCRRAARNGSGIGCYYCGVIYEMGAITKVNMKTAFSWYSRSADLDCTKGYIGLARLNFKGYPDGFRGKVDFAEGWRKMTYAAEKGDVEAILFLGNSCYNGKIVKKDVNEAAKWYRRGAELNDPLCQYYLGEILISQRNATSNNREEAFKLFKASAQQGCVPAAKALEYYSGDDPYNEFFKYAPKVANVVRKDESTIAMMAELNDRIAKHLASWSNETKRERLAESIDELFNRYRSKCPSDVVSAMNDWRESAKVDYSGVMDGPSEQTKELSRKAFEATLKTNPSELKAAYGDVGRAGLGALKVGFSGQDDDLFCEGFGEYMGGFFRLATRSQSARESVVYTITSGVSAWNDAMIRDNQIFEARKARDEKLIPAIRRLQDVAARYGYGATEDE